MDEKFTSEATVTLSLSVTDLLRRGGYLGEDDDREYFSAGLMAEVAERAASLVANRLTGDESFYSRMAGVIESKLETIVDEALAEPVQETDRFGRAMGEGMPLRNLLAHKVETALQRWMSVNTANLPARTRFEDYLDKQVDRIVRQDLNKTLDAARKQVQAAVTAQAAEMVASAAAKIQAAGR